MGVKRLQTIAHRAGNSLARLRAAEDAGVDVVEADVWLHHGVLEARHEKSLRPLPLLWDKWRLQAAWTPRLKVAELLSAARADTGFMFDLKGLAPALPASLIEATASCVENRRLMVCGQNWRMLEPFAAHPHFTIVHSVGRTEQLRRVWPLLDAVEHDAVSVHYRLLDRDLVLRLKERVTMVITWPINDAERLERVRDLGVDGVTSDEIGLLRGL